MSTSTYLSLLACTASVSPPTQASGSTRGAVVQRGDDSTLLVPPASLDLRRGPIIADEDG